MPQRKAFWLLSFENQEDSGWHPRREHVISTAKTIHADGVDVQAVTEVVNAEFVKACRKAGLSVHVWTVDKEDAARHFQRIGVDSITTNRPDFLRQVLFQGDALEPEPTPELIGQ